MSAEKRGNLSNKLRGIGVEFRHRINNRFWH